MKSVQTYRLYKEKQEWVHNSVANDACLIVVSLYTTMTSRRYGIITLTMSRPALGYRCKLHLNINDIKIPNRFVIARACT